MSRGANWIDVPSLLKMPPLVTLLKMHIPTLVVVSVIWAPAISSAALALSHHRSPEECFQLVAAHHAHDISTGLWNEVTAVLPRRDDRMTMTG